MGVVMFVSCETLRAVCGGTARHELDAELRYHV